MEGNPDLKWLGEISSILRGSDFKSAFQAIARYFGRPSSHEVIFSGIPITESSVEFDEVEQIASRIGLEVEYVSVSNLKDVRLPLPAIVQFQNGSYAAVIERASNGHLLFGFDNSSGLLEAEREGLMSAKVDHAYAFSALYLNSADRAEVGTSQQIEKRHWLFGTLKTFWRGYAYIALAAVFINLIALSTPIFSMNVYDRVLPNKATSSLLTLAAGVSIALIFDMLLKGARSIIIDQTGRAADIKISYMLFDKVLHTSLSARPSSTGEYANRISQIEFVREFFTSNTIATLIDSTFVFIFLIVIYIIAGWLAIIPLIALFCAIFIGLIAQHRIGKRVARAANESAQRQSLLVETISIIETVKSLKAETALLRKWNELTKNSSRTSEEIKQLSASAANATSFIQQMVSIILVIAGAFEFAKGNMSTGAIIATVMLSGRTVAPLAQITMTLARLRQASLSLSILNTIMELPEDRPSTTGFVSRPIDIGEFQFEDVGFQYPGNDQMVLKSVNLSVKVGERVGIIGRIGSGKTTIGRLLAGLYLPVSGRLLVNNIDIRQYHPAVVRGAVALVSQNADLFSGTLKENLLIGNPNATDDEIIEAAKKAGVDEFATLHPRGYDLSVGERGNNLSGGQRQAVAIARMLLVKPKIVFLDEPTGAMDMASEKQLIRALASAFGKDTTLIISTHRFSLLDIVDRLIVLDQGKIVADGPKDKVLAALAARAQMTKA